MKYIGGILALVVCAFLNGIWELVDAPEYYNGCQKVHWAQEQNKNKFAPDAWVSLWLVEKVNCKGSPDDHAHSKGSPDEHALSKLRPDDHFRKMARAFLCWHIADEYNYEEDFYHLSSMLLLVKTKKEDDHTFNATKKVMLDMSKREKIDFYTSQCSPLMNAAKAKIAADSISQ